MPRPEPKPALWRRLRAARVALILAAAVAALCGKAELLPRPLPGIVAIICLVLAVALSSVLALRPCEGCGESGVGLAFPGMSSRPCPKCGHSERGAG